MSFLPSMPGLNSAQAGRQQKSKTAMRLRERDITLLLIRGALDEQRLPAGAQDIGGGESSISFLALDLVEEILDHAMIDTLIRLDRSHAAVFRLRDVDDRRRQGGFDHAVVAVAGDPPILRGLIAQA